MSAKDSSGTALAPGDSVKTVSEISIPNKGKIPSGTSLKVDAFGRTPNYIDVSFQGKTWYVDAAKVKKG